MQTPEPLPPLRSDPQLRPPRAQPRPPLPADWGERIAWVSGLVLAVSAFTGWYTGPLGKLVFFLGLATLILEALREAGIALPATVPERLVLIAFGALATIFVLIRLLSVPDTYFAATSRGVGLYITLVAALALIAAGLLRGDDV